MASLGLGWGEVHARWPAMIMASISAYGNEGPNHARPGMDIIVQAGTGLGRVVALHDRSSTLHQIRSDNRCLSF